MTKDVDLKITGDPEGLEAALGKAKSAVRTAVGDMERGFAGLNNALQVAQRAMVAFAAVLGGGAAFKAAVDSTVNLSKESVELGRSLGIGATEASVLTAALDDIYATSDQVTAATSKIAQTLNTDEQAFARLGVATRDQNGHFRNSFDILLDVNGRLNELKEGTDRNIAGQQIFGKAWASMAPLLKLNADLMAETREKAAALGLVIGQEDVEATIRYRAALNDAGNVMQAFQKVIGDALLPSLTETATWFADIGPRAVQLLRNAIAGITQTFIVVQAAFVGFGQAMGSIATQVVTVFTALGRVIALALKGDFSGAKAAWTEGLAALDAIAEAADEDRIAREARTAARIAAVWDQASNPKRTPVEAPAGGGTFTETDESGKNRMSGWQTGLDEAKAAWSEQQRLEGSFREYSKEQEVAYWQDILATQRLSTAERLSVRSKVAQLQLAIDKEAFAAEIENLKSGLAEFKENGEARLAIAREIAERMRTAYGEDSQQYAAARKDVVATERQIAADLLQERQEFVERSAAIALADVDADELAARERAALNLQTTEELLQQEREFEDRRYEIRRQALEAIKQLEAASGDKDPDKIRKLLSEIEALELEHHQRQREIRTRQVIESQREWLGALRQMEGGFKTAIAGMLKGTTTFAEGMRQMTAAVVGAVIDMIAQLAAQWLVAQIAQIVGVKTTTASTIPAKAAEAGAAGTASWAGAPWPINMRAPAFGAAMAATAGAYSAGLSAAGGFDIPSNLNPVTQLHAREMVLPADLADTVRAMAGVAGAGGGGGYRQAGSISIHAVDSRSIKRLFQDPNNRRHLFDAVVAKAGSRIGRRPR